MTTCFVLSGTIKVAKEYDKDIHRDKPARQRLTIQAAGAALNR